MQSRRLSLRQWLRLLRTSGDRMKKGIDAGKRTHPDSDYVHPDKLEFDPENPRFGGLLTGKSQEELQLAIFGEPYYASELVDSLLENGFIDYEPLVVARKADKFI